VAIDEPFQPRLYTERIALYTDDLRYVVDSEGQTTYIERLPDPAAGDSGDRWSVPAGGRPVSLSPGRTRIAWEVSNNALAVETRVTDIWIARLDGSEPQSVISLPRGGLVGWISEDMILVSGRESLASSETVLWTYSLSDNTSVELVRGERLRGPTLSPDGRWLVYYETFGDPGENGLWVVRTDAFQRLPLPRELFGAYQWRDSERLLIVPFRPDAEVHSLWQFDVEEGTAGQLTDPSVTPFKIAGGDWRVSPDGRQVVFVASSDLNLWVLTLGE
jgi:Tol biopolymer transport system component